jgi:GT2 family glycosyltransferase
VSADISVIILTRGDRPVELAAAVSSVARQRGVVTETIVVINGVAAAGADETGSPPLTIGLAVRRIDLPTNVGIPEGRNVGARVATGRHLFFLDDDAALTECGTLAAIVARLDAAPDFAVVGLRIVDEHGHTARRHVPRWGDRSAATSGEVTGFLGGAVAIRRRAFEMVGGYAGEYFYSMEETDLSLRLIDSGWRIWYDADSTAQHPRTDPARHADAARRTARNRVWLVHRTLPLPCALAYLLNWFIATAVRSPSAVRFVADGYRDGWRTRIGPRRPIRWSTVLRLTRLGRPPVL